MGISFGTFTEETSRALLGVSTMQTQPTLFVNSYTGNDTNSGQSPDQALGTIGRALALANNGTTIGIFGVFKEHCTTRLGLQDITIVGLANTPRQATTSGAANGGGATWMNASGGTTALLTVQGQGITVRNVFFANSATAAPCIDLVTVGDPPTQADAAHFLLDGCILTGADNGLDATDGTNFVRINNTTFFGFSGSGDIAINATGGVGTLLDWRITNCRFYNNTITIVAALSTSLIQNCTFKKGSGAMINLTNGTAPNYVVNNFFDIAAADFDPTGGVTGVTGDVWSNYLKDTIETGLPTD